MQNAIHLTAETAEHSAEALCDKKYTDNFKKSINKK